VGAQSQKQSQFPQSPETYLGTDRRANYVPFPAKLTINQWMLIPRYESARTDPNGHYGKFADYWQEDADSILARQSGGTLTLSYQARDVYLVLG
jgi:hypothetical protein